MIPKNNLRACPDHRVVVGTNEPCPCCEIGVEARPDAFEGDVTDIHMRQQIEPERMHEMLPRLEAAAEEVGAGPVFVAVAELSEAEIQGAYGYTRQERWFNVVGIQINQNVDWILDDPSAKDVLEALEAGENPITLPEYDYDRLDPEIWMGVPDAYATTVDYEREDPSTLRITLDGFASDNGYSQCRKELGWHAKNMDLDIRTIEAGGRYSHAIIEISIPDDQEGVDS